MSYKIHMPHWPPVPLTPPVGEVMERMRTLLAGLGNPQEKLPPVVHVAGTNGKGSTMAFLRAMLEAAGYRVHVYTSPHLIRFNERIRLAGELIGDGMLAEVTEAARLAAAGMNITFFEGTTAMALLAFARIPADIVLVETGMGGEFDPTNAIDKKLLTLITGISRDHTEYLGRSVAEIAAHKAGIMRSGVPCIVSAQPDEVSATLQQAGETIGAPLYMYGRHWAASADGAHMRYRDSHGAVDLPLPNLPGAHQLVNAGNAIAAVTALTDFIIPGEAIEYGLMHAEWPGRLERIERGRVAALLPAGWELWFDGGHNAAGGAAIAEWVRGWDNKNPLPLPSSLPPLAGGEGGGNAEKGSVEALTPALSRMRERETYMIFGTTRGKDMAEILAPFAGAVAHVQGINVAAEPNCYSAEEVAAAAQSAGLPASVAANMEEAVTDIIHMSEQPARILVFGSLYHRMELVG